MIISHTHKMRVRYGETDQMSVVYYGNYPEYYEVGRAEAMRAIGIEYKVLEEEHHIMMPVVHMEINYIRPIEYDELIEMETYLMKIKNGFAYFRVEIRNEKGKLANVGKMKLCFIDRHSRKRVEPPAYVMTKIKDIIA